MASDRSWFKTTPIEMIEDRTGECTGTRGLSVLCGKIIATDERSN